MLRKINFSLIFSVMLLLTLMFPVGVHAENTNTSDQIDEVLIKMEDETVVAIPLVEYAQMYILKSGDLYELLVDSNGQLNVHGLVSGEKFIAIGDYTEAYLLNSGNIPTALEEAEAIDESIVETFMKVEIDEETGEINLVPIKDGSGQEEPTITATYRSSFLSNFVYVSIEVDGLQGAEKFSVEYYVEDLNIGPVLEETEVFNIGEETGLIFYNPELEEPYDKVNVKIYDINGELIYTFVDVVLMQ